MDIKHRQRTVLRCGPGTPGEPSELAARASGVICNRPDGEGPDQPTFDGNRAGRGSGRAGAVATCR